MSWIGGVVGWLIGSSSSSDCIKPELSEPKGRKEETQKSKVGSSTLNPNAKVFTPPLNPNAKEFTPAKRDQHLHQQLISEVSSTSPYNSPTPIVTEATSKQSACDDIVAAAAEKQDSEKASNNFEKSSQEECFEKSPQKDVFEEPAHKLTPSNSACVTPICVSPTCVTSTCVTPEMEEPLKSTNQRLSTPWVQNGDDKTSRNFDDTDEDILDCDDFNFSLDDDEEEDESDDDDENDDLEEFVLQGNGRKSPVCDDDGKW